jgi:hypothetical protein
MAMDDSTRSTKHVAIETPGQREKRLAYHREWMRQFRAKHPEKSREANRRWVENNRDKVKKTQAKRYVEHRKKIIAAVSEYCKRNRKKINETNRRRRLLDPEKHNARSRNWYHERRKKDPESVAKRRKRLAEYMRLKRNSDPAYIVADRLRRRINSALSSAGASKSGKLIDVAGCSVQDLVAHIESQFLLGMTWENRREWHIDHVVPCSAFDLTDESQQAVAFHYKNLRPIWASSNQRKHAKIPGGQRQLFWTIEHVQKAKKKLRLY